MESSVNSDRHFKIDIASDNWQEHLWYDPNNSDQPSYSVENGLEMVE